MEKLVAPSILSADFGNLRAACEMLNASEADWVHVDIMDGVFVPNLSFGFPVVSAIAMASTKPLDVHLMIVNPDAYIEKYADLGADTITVHLEACTHLHRTVEKIKKAGCKAGVALNPHSSVLLIEDIAVDLDLILLMSVNPGFGGQSFIMNTLRKLYKLMDVKNRIDGNFLIEIDGGVNNKLAGVLYEAGANVMVSGNSIFGAENPIVAIRELKEIARLHDFTI